MIAADIITYFTNSDEKKYGTTIRNLPEIENETAKEKKSVSYMYSESQIAATIFMTYNIDTSFSPLFAIQLAAFLMTLVKKGIIKDSHSRLLYSLALWSIIFPIIFYTKDVNFFNGYSNINNSKMLINLSIILILFRFIYLNHFILYKM